MSREHDWHRGRRSAMRTGADHRGPAAHRGGRVRDAGLRDSVHVRWVVVCVMHVIKARVGTSGLCMHNV